MRLNQFNQSDEVDSCTQTANIDGILPKSSYAFGNSKGDVIRYNNVQGYVKSCTNLHMTHDNSVSTRLSFPKPQWLQSF